ncbi:TPA: hypothetical protein ACN34M_004552 [Vibrio parahaemolyticus]|uniref:hypothetical protein n=1 Tax=Vibrio campbellii TaxID=680 RepID=UPI003B7669ED
MLKEPEQLAMLHHRFCRTLEIEVAYHSFLKQEVMVGEDYYCLHEPLRQSVTHTLLITFYSYIYSLFDPRGVNVGQVPSEVIEKLSEQGKEALDIANEAWAEIKTPISKIRSNIGFHHSSKKSGATHGYDSYKEIHPLSTLLIVKALRLFFRNVYQVFESEVPRPPAPTADENEHLLQELYRLKKCIEDNSLEDILKIMEKIG